MACAGITEVEIHATSFIPALARLSSRFLALTLAQTTHLSWFYSVKWASTTNEKQEIPIVRSVNSRALSCVSVSFRVALVLFTYHTHQKGKKETPNEPNGKRLSQRCYFLKKKVSEHTNSGLVSLGSRSAACSPHFGYIRNLVLALPVGASTRSPKTAQTPHK